MHAVDSSSKSASWQTYVDVARCHAVERPDQVAFIFLDEQGEEAGRLTFAELDLRARAVAARLQLEGARGERVLLMYDAGLEFVVGFLGCLYAGAVAVPAYPPARREGRRHRLQRIITDCEPRLALSERAVQERFDGRWLNPTTGPTPQLLLSDTLEDGLASLWQEPELGPQDLAFLQYTSGSTETPAGVRVSHANLLSNQRAIKEGFGHGGQTIFAGWVPLFHDMGLVGNVLHPLYLGILSVLMSPYAVLRTPSLWLRAITRYRATTSGGPNFAYELCTRAVSERERAELDLSSWSVAFNGAEPIFAETLERFAATFAPCGFRREAFLPCYGLAEATLLVSCGSPKQAYVSAVVSRRALEQGASEQTTADDPANLRTLVSSGVAREGVRLAVVDPDGRRMLPDGRVGEIWVAGPSVGDGYWRPGGRGSRFRARLEDEGDASAEWLRTGDLGFLMGGELFVTGRRSDLIIVRGRNYHPQEIERTAENAHTALLPHSSAAFTVTDEGATRVVLVQEVRRTALRSFQKAEAEAAVRAAVASQHELTIHEILFARPGSVTKTSSGKINRAATREDYLGSRLAGVGVGTPARLADEDAPSLQTLEGVAPEVCVERIADGILVFASQALGRPLGRQMRERSLAALGADSLNTVSIQKELEGWLGRRVPLDWLLSERPVAELARSLLGVVGEDRPRGTRLAADRRTRGPASEYQKAVWLGQRLNPESDAYNLAWGLRLPLALPEALVRSAVRLLLERHPGLLTAFEHDPHAPDNLTQRFVTPEPLPLTVTDARRWSEAALNRSLEDEVGRGFDLESGSTFRAVLYERGEGESLLVLLSHHLVVDAWSMFLLVEDLSRIVESLTAERPLALLQRPSPIDYAAWQRELLEGPRGGELRDYWREVFTSPPPALKLISDAQLPDFRPGEENLYDFRVPPELSAGVEELARANGCTAGTVYLAALQCLLHRYTEATDIVVPVPVSVRPAGAEHLIGYAVNLLPIRVTVSSESTFEELLLRVRGALAGALDHRELPLTYIVGEWRREDASTRLSLGPVMFVWQAGESFRGAGRLLTPGARVQFGGVEASVARLPPPRSPEGVILSLTLADDGALTGRLHFDSLLFGAATMARLAGHYLTLLGDALSDPRRKMSDLLLLTPGEFRTQLIEWNRGPISSAPPRLAIERIEEQIRRSPGRTAIVCGGEALSYAELGERVEGLAQSLRARGIGRSQRVGVSLPRCSELVISLLALWKIGAAYVPLDPALPKQRLRGYVEDAGCSLILHRPPAHAQNSVQADLHLGVPAMRPHRNGSLSATPAGEPVSADDVAYILFTSGSTGRPKGVQVEQRAVAALLEWVTTQYEPEELDAVLAATSISFDISLFELLAPLLVGGAVVIADSILDLPKMNRPLTLVNTVPSAAAALLDVAGIPASVRTLNLAGEHLPQALVGDIYARTHVRKVYDLYGPTEDTVFSTATLRTPGGFDNIGRPVGGSQAFVVDGNLQPVPVCVAGELLLGGAKLARGYVGRPDLTAAAFLTDTPLKSLAPRLYRTGDIVRQLPDGRLQYLGRRDQQLKLRGFRVELGEIEARLSRLPEVREAAVVAQTTSLGEKRLVAFVVPEEGVAVTPERMREALARELPDYMLPGSFSLLSELPRNVNGKLDRQRLPTVAAAQGPTQTAVAPRTPTERRLYELWEPFFPGQTFGVYDNFFALGGDSLRALQVHARICHEFHVNIAPSIMMSLPTITSLAASLELATTEPPSDYTEVLV